MTLPNRSGYVVEERKPFVMNQQPNRQVHQPSQTPSSQNHAPLPQSPVVNSPLPPTSGSMKFMYNVQGNPHTPPVMQQNEELSGGLFGFEAQHNKLPTQSNDFFVEPMHNNKSKVDGLFKSFQCSPAMSLSIEEMHARKSYIRQHRLLSDTIKLVVCCKEEGLIPPLEPLTFLDNGPEPGTIDFSLDDFLQSQGIEQTPLMSDDPQKNSERNEFAYKLEQLKTKYNQELEKLNQVCNEFCNRMLHLLREQSQLRPVSETESHLKILAIQQKFDYIKGQLRQNCCNAIHQLQKRYNQTKKKRRALPKKATDALSNWFYEHITDPYPTEEDKNYLASAAGLTLTQVNNWFGNKRIRYKRKCLEQEAKRARGLIPDINSEHGKMDTNPQQPPHS